MRDNRYLIHLLSQGARVRLVPNRHLDESLFSLYREACRMGGALFEDQRIGYTVSIDGIHYLIDSLRKYGFQPNVSPQLFNLIANKNPLPATNKVNDWIIEIQSRLKKNEYHLRKYQEEAVRILHTQKSWLLLDEQGCGKSLELISSIPDNVPVLIICPAIAKRNVWESEFKKFRPEYKTTVLQGLNSFRWPKAGEAVITNYNILPEAEQIKQYPAWGIKPSRELRMVAHRCYDIKTKELVTVPFEQTPPPKLVIITDEIQNLMNLSAKRTKAFRGIMNAAKRVDATTWGATGTELDSNPMQLWNLLTLYGLEKQAYQSWSNFLRIFGGTQTGYGTKKDPKTGKATRGFGRSIEWRVPGPNDPPNREAIEGMRRISIKRKLEDVMPEIPPMTIKDIYVEIDEITQKQCDKALDELKQLGISLDDAIDHCINSRDGGVPFKEMAIANKMLAIAKTPFVLEFIEDYQSAKEPVLVFSMHRPPLDMLGKREGWDVITGSTSEKNRSKIINAFQSGEFNNLALSIKAAGVALNLDRAANSFFIDFAYTPAANRQAYARIRRFSQRRPQFIFRFIANHALDKRKVELLDAREAIIDNTTDAASIKGEATHLFNETTGVVGHGVLVTDPRSYQIRAQVKRHTATNDRERWIERMMREMVRRDSDHATLFNRLGFSKADSKIGLDLVGQLKQGLSDRQWLTAERILKRYSNQIGTFENPKI